MLIEFSRVGQGATVATIHRRDGVVVELRGYSVTHRVPHDLAHVVTERELGLAGGVFGSIAGGAVFASMRVVGGRPRHDAAARSKRILRANARALTTAEVMAGVVHDAVEYGPGSDPHTKGRVDWAIVHPEPFPWSADRIDEAVRHLTDLAGELERTGAVAVLWPDRLTSPVPAEPHIRRGRHGRV
jgi:hypothetical protein